ncbi:MAG: LemA family protein [Pleurocapsa sp.]
MEDFISIIFIFIGLILVIGFGIVAIVINIYNSLIYKKNQVDRSFSSVDVLLKKRCDLIPNLVAVVKQHMQFEQQTLAEITRLRSRVMSGEVSEEQRITLENQISRTMGNILALIENYPELNSNQHVTQLLASLNEIEEQISAARRFFNTAVTEYNNAIEMFPSNLVANSLNYRTKQLFIATEEDRANVNVGNLFNN